MSGDGAVASERRTRWLPAAVVTVFALVLAGDAAMLLFDDEVRRMVDGETIEVYFTPLDVPDAAKQPIAVDSVAGTADPADDGPVAVRSTDAGIEIGAPGELLIRFRVDDAGGFVELDYAFGGDRRDASCDVTLARVPSRYGVDRIGRRTLVVRKTRTGVFRHSLTDHVGWFELTVAVDAGSAADGVTIGLPEIVWE